MWELKRKKEGEILCVCEWDSDRMKERERVKHCVWVRLTERERERDLVRIRVEKCNNWKMDGQVSIEMHSAENEKSLQVEQGKK